MDISFNQESWLRRTGALLGKEQGQTGSAWPGAERHPLLDWQGLSARLSAAYALRRAMAGQDVLDTASSASFNEGVAGALSVYGTSQGAGFGTEATAAATGPDAGNTASDTLPAINPVGLGDGKAPSGIHAALLHNTARA